MIENAANLELAADIVSAYVSNNSLPALERNPINLYRIRRH
jgi:predicted transcriptional regulator